jgi:hypothetical protein
MKYIYSNNDFIINNTFLKLLKNSFIIRGYYLIYKLDYDIMLYGYIYVLAAIDLFLGYVMYNECHLVDLEIYFLNCLKIIICLYDDICDLDFSFRYISRMTGYNDINFLIKVQKDIMEFYDYNFNVIPTIIDYMDGFSYKKCISIGYYIEGKLCSSRFLLLSPERKIKKILKKID